MLIRDYICLDSIYIYLYLHTYTGASEGFGLRALGFGPRDSMQMMKQTLKSKMASSQQLTVLDCCLYLNAVKIEIPYAICIEQFTSSLTII